MRGIIVKIIKFIGNALLAFVVILFGLTAAISFFSAPDDEGLFGFKGYTVVSGSMEPAFSTGDFVFVRTNELNDVKEGDVVTFMRNEEIVTHRAVAVTDAGVTTKGDANNIQDQGQVTQESYIGELALILPYFGYVVVAVQQPIVLIGLAVLLGMYFILIYVKEAKEEKQKAAEKNS